MIMVQRILLRRIFINGCNQIWIINGTHLNETDSVYEQPSHFSWMILGLSLLERGRRNYTTMVPLSKCLAVCFPALPTARLLQWSLFVFCVQYRYETLLNRKTQTMVSSEQSPVVTYPWQRVQVHPPHSNNLRNDQLTVFHRTWLSACSLSKSWWRKLLTVTE